MEAQRKEKCDSESWQRLLGAYLDEELTPSQKARVSGHLAGCPRCRRELRLLSRMASAISQLPEWAPEPSLLPAVLARTVGSPRPWRLRLYRFEPMLRLGFVAAVFVALTTVILASGLPQLLISPVTTIVRTTLSNGIETAREAGRLLSPLAKLDVIGGVLETLGESALTLAQAPPAELYLGGFLALFFLVLLSARLLASRTGRVVDHVCLCV